MTPNHPLAGCPRRRAVRSVEDMQIQPSDLGLIARVARASASATDTARARSPPSTTSRSASAAASSPPSWARRARASRRSCTSWPASTRRTAGRAWLGDTEITELSRLGAHGAAPAPGRLRVPVVQPRADARRARQRACCRSSSTADGRAATSRPGSTSSIDALGLGTAPRATGRTSSRAASSSAWRSPARSRTRPDLVFADEPTGNLDSRTGREVLGLLATASARYGQSIAMVTHDPVAASHADRILFLADGRIVRDARALVGRGDLRVHARRWRSRPDAHPAQRTSGRRSWSPPSRGTFGVALLHVTGLLGAAIAADDVTGESAHRRAHARHRRDGVHRHRRLRERDRHREHRVDGRRRPHARSSPCCASSGRAPVRSARRSRGRGCSSGSSAR